MLERFNSNLTRADDVPECWCFDRDLGAGMETIWRSVSGVFIPQIQSPGSIKACPAAPNPVLTA